MTANEVLKLAAGELGYTESPANSNRTKYGKWFGFDGQPWCMMFVQRPDRLCPTRRPPARDYSTGMRETGRKASSIQQNRGTL